MLLQNNMNPGQIKEHLREEKIRSIMNQRRITYQEAEQIVESGQKSIWDY